MSKRSERLPEAASVAGGGLATRPDVATFLAEVKAAAPVKGGNGRLVFALDATMSRQPTWDLACALQAEMFDAAARVGGLAVQLVYFRGHAEARASRWISDAAALKRLMTGIACHGGLTQIGRVLEHAEREASKRPLAALVYVGDSMEEDIDRLCGLAGALGVRGTRAFLFHEGRDPVAARAFREIARLTRGVYLPFDARAAGELKALLGAVGAWAAGGRPALEAAGTGAARRLLADLTP
jgi:hypothetical protein